MARQNSGNFAILSWDFLRKFCNISTPDAFLFGSKRNFDVIKSFISVFTRFAHRTLAECTIFSCASLIEGAPKFRRFTKICVISTLRACFFYGSERTVDSNESAGEAIRFTQRTLPGKNKILCAWRAEIPEILQIFPILSQDVGINFALSRRRAPA